MADIIIPILLLVVVLFGAWQLRRLLHACRRANRVDWGKGWVNLLDGFIRLFCYRYHRLNMMGLRIPKAGPAILACNHVSGVDPFLIIASARRPIRFLIAKEEYEHFGLQWMFRGAKCIPVDREGRPEQALRSAIRALQKGHVVAIFPHGKICDPDGPPVRIKPGVIRLAQLTGTDILPLRITGIKGAGHVVRGVVLRSNARLESFSKISVGERVRDDLLDELQQILDG